MPRAAVLSLAACVSALHVQRRHFFVRDMVESFVIEVPFVPTKDNIADILTKPMKDAKQFHRLRKMIYERGLTLLAMPSHA